MKKGDDNPGRQLTKRGQQNKKDWLPQVTLIQTSVSSSENGNSIYNANIYLLREVINITCKKSLTMMMPIKRSWYY